MTTHHYTGPAHDATYTLGARDRPRELLGSGDSPSDAWLNRVGWHRVADHPNPPAPTGYRWTPGDPEYALAGVVSTPQGAWEPIPLPDLKAARAAAITAECESRFAARWPETDRTLSVAGVPLEPASPEVINDAIAHQEARDAALILVEAATDAAGVAAVTVGWPE